MRSCIAGLLVTLVLLLPAQADPGANTGVSKQRVLKLMADFGRQQESILLQKGVDIGELAGSLQTRAAKSQWVRDNILLVPYRGLLRGSSGVAEDRLGNSLDRALFLGALLQASGIEARLARATLDETAATELLSLVRREAEPVIIEDATESLDQLISQSLGTEGEKVSSWIATQAEEFNTEKLNRDQDLFRQTEEVAGALLPLAVKAAADRAQTFSSVHAEAVEMLRDHWWVQVREDSGWVDCDTTLDADGSTRSTVYKTLALDAPLNSPDEDLRHVVKLRLIAEVGDENGPVREVALLQREWMAGNVQAIRGVITHIPRVPFEEELLVKMVDGKVTAQEILQNHSSWVPVVQMDGNFSTDTAFSFDGQLEDLAEGLLQALLTAGAGVGSSTAVALDSSTKLLSGMDQDMQEPAMPIQQHITAERLELEFISPGRPPRLEVRPLFRTQSKLKFDGPESATVLSALTGTFDFVISFSAFDAQKIAGELNGGAAALAEVSGAVLAGVDPPNSVIEELQVFVPASLGYESSRWATHDQAGLVYVAQPQVIGLWRRVENTAGQFKYIDEFDVIAHEIALRPVAGVNPFELRLVQGVGDTVSEYLSHANEAEAVGNTAYAFSRDQRAGKAWKFIESGDAWLTTLPDITRHVIASDLATGSLIYAPATLASNEDLYFFRINPVSGETLGMGPTGRGTSSVEKAALLVNVTVCFEAALRPLITSILGISNTPMREMIVGAVAVPFCALGGGAGMMAGRGGLSLALGLIGNIVAAAPDYFPD